MDTFGYTFAPVRTCVALFNQSVSNHTKLDSRHLYHQVQATKDHLQSSQNNRQRLLHKSYLLAKVKISSIYKKKKSIIFIYNELLRHPIDFLPYVHIYLYIHTVHTHTYTL